MIDKKGFTLVELIIVVVILSILGTVGFIGYSKYLVGVRDAARQNQLIEIGEGLKRIFLKKRLPLPDDKVEVRVDGEVIAYQGYVGQTVLDIIGYNKDGVDPKTGTYYTYYVSKDRKYFQLLSYLEKDPEVALNIISNTTYANIIDYSFKFISTHGAKLGVLTDEFNTPIQEISSIKTNGYIDLLNENADQVFKATIDNERTYEFSGSILAYKLKTLALGGKYIAPDDCAPGFIGVWGDSEFNQKGFCISKYEMTYTEIDSPGTPDSTGGGDDWNTYAYDSTKQIASRIDYPITNITQSQAISACKGLGKGYHLVTNNEWMAIARQIEFEGVNWSSGKPERIYSYVFPGNTSYGDDGRGCVDVVGPRSKGAKAGESESETCANIRQLNLFDQNTIRDFAGNIAEHVNKANTIDGSGFDSGKTELGGGSGWDELTTIDDSEKWYTTPIIGLDLNESMGGVYKTEGNDNNVFVRGGNFDDSEYVGIYTLYNSWQDGREEPNVGFRCVK